jgi:DNA-binding CsgD family transcriptional regulator
MTAGNTTGTVTGNLASACIRRGYRGLDTKMVIVASNNRNVQEWLYRYLEPYGAKGYGFYQVENKADFSECAGKPGMAIAFVEDIFFGERTIGKLDYICKQYPKLRLAVFSASNAPLGAAARYVCWGLGSYLSLRDGDGEIEEAVEAVFGRRQAVPLYLRESVDEYVRLPYKKPYLTHREIEIVRYAAEGKTAGETASVLMLSRRTVQNHISNIYRKFGIRNMAGGVKLAVTQGILPVEELMAFTVSSVKM